MNIQLSPINYLTAIATLRINESNAGDYDDDAEEVTMYRCAVCEELHEWSTAARKCCSDKKAKPEGSAACPVCNEQHTTHRNAADYCLWKDLDATTRWEIADKVENDSDWKTELGLHI